MYYEKLMLYTQMDKSAAWLKAITKNPALAYKMFKNKSTAKAMVERVKNPNFKVKDVTTGQLVDPISLARRDLKQGFSSIGDGVPKTVQQRAQNIINSAAMRRSGVRPANGFERTGARSYERGGQVHAWNGLETPALTDITHLKGNPVDAARFYHNKNYVEAFDALRNTNFKGLQASIYRPAPINRARMAPRNFGYEAPGYATESVLYAPKGRLV